MKLLVQYINASTGLLLEVVNYNVQEQQYVCAGHVSIPNISIIFMTILIHVQLQALWILGQACDELATNHIFSKYSPKDIQTVVHRLTPMSKLVPQPIELPRGRATVPLSGIDIPFHSSYLREGIDVFRECLVNMIREDAVVPEQLVGKFIPNVMGSPFSLETEYVEEAARITGSKMLRSLLDARA